MHDWERWLTDGNRTTNGAGLLLTLNHASESEVTRAMEVLRERGIEAVVSASEGDVAVRYADLVGQLKKQNDEKDGSRPREEVFRPC